MSRLQQIHDELWVIDHPFCVAGLHLGTRTTLVRTPDGLWMHSPGPLGNGMKDEIENLGQVAHIVAPNTMHYTFFEENKKAFPEAVGWAGEALRAKVPGLPVDGFLEETDEWRGGLAALTVAGIPRLEETVFYHAASRSLILTDLVFNLQHSGHCFTRTMMKLNGAYGRLGPSRLFRYLLTTDVRKLGASLDTVLRWGFERVIMGHGEILHKGGDAAMRNAFAWALEPALGSRE